MFQTEAKIEELSFRKPKPQVETLTNTFKVKILKLKDFRPNNHSPFFNVLIL
jgi:hypothetical protein